MQASTTPTSKKATKCSSKTAHASDTCTPFSIPTSDGKRPNAPYRTENAKRKGLGNASAGELKVVCGIQHFGPIGPEHVEKEHVHEHSSGVLVGETWPNRLECHQWGAHRPHVAGIAGQADVGSQSIVIAGVLLSLLLSPCIEILCTDGSHTC